MSVRASSSLNVNGVSHGLLSVEGGDHHKMDGLVEYAERDLAKPTVEIGGGEHGRQNLDEMGREHRRNRDVAEEIGGENRVVEVAVDNDDGDLAQRERFECFENGGGGGGVGTGEDTESNRADDEGSGEKLPLPHGGEKGHAGKFVDSEE